MEKTKYKVALLHCFPVPYRNHLFEAMSKECIKNNIEFEVHFFSSFDKSRPKWKFKSEDLNYKHYFWKPIFKVGPALHLNLDMLFFLKKNKPDLIILGGVWSSFNTILFVLFSNIPLIAWDETNRFDFGNVKKRFYGPKRFLINKLKYLAIPGLESKLFYHEILPDKSFYTKKFFYLPNLVNEDIFENSKLVSNANLELILKYNIPNDKKVIYWPARFIPHKGIINFISHLNDTILKDWIIIILGDGPLKSETIDFIKAKKLDTYFRVFDLLPYDEALKLYFISDLLIMPSIADSNPLSVIEAIHSSLPILVSNRIGNYNEVLIDRKNGVSVDPFDLESMKDGIEFIFSKNKSELLEMGKVSKELAIKNYSTKTTIEKFVTEIQEILN
jgi:glycosyltransferase involved in cell wall biosynthesis